jgi:hypothetical protein
MIESPETVNFFNAGLRTFGALLMLVAIDRTPFFLYTGIISLLEIGKFVNGQPILSLARNVTFATSLFGINPFLTRVFAFFLIAFDLTETISWFYTKSGFNVQIVMAIDVTWIVQHHREFLWLFLFLFSLLLLLVCLPFSPKIVRVRPWHAAFFSLCALLLGFNIFNSFSVNLDPFKARQDLGSLQRKMHNSTDVVLQFLFDPITAKVFREPPKRNLIILELESLEYELLGVYNRDYPQLLPFLSEFVRRGTYFINVTSQPYTTWSVASMFAAQCNLPLLLNHVVPNFQGQFHLSKNLRCLGDYLDMAGYDLVSYQTNVFLGDFKTHLRMHKYKAFDFKDHRIRRDWDLFAKIQSDVLGKMTTPFILHIANADCHAFPRYVVDSRCARRIRTGPLIVRSFDCVDQILERFIRAFERSPIFNSTDLLLYGDHVVMEGNHKGLTLNGHRALVLAFPYHEEREVTKIASIYDIAPTIMAMLGIEYAPRFPFGGDLFGEEVGRVPTVDSFQTICDLFTSEMKWDRNTTCRGAESGFCTYAVS